MEREREEGDKEGEDEGKKESLRKTKESRGPRHKTFFLREATVHLSKKQHPTQSLCVSIRAGELLPRAVC